MGEENGGRLACVSPTRFRDYTVQGGRFKIGVLPKDIMSQVSQLQREGKQFEANWLAVQYGVKAHEALVFEDNDEPVPFETEKDDQKREHVSEVTMYVYLGTGLVAELSAEVFTKGGGRRHRVLVDRLESQLDQVEAAREKIAASG